jgi:hypothetical protein
MSVKLPTSNSVPARTSDVGLASHKVLHRALLAIAVLFVASLSFLFAQNAYSVSYIVDTINTAAVLGTPVQVPHNSTLNNPLNSDGTFDPYPGEESAGAFEHDQTLNDRAIVQIPFTHSTYTYEEQGTGSQQPGDDAHADILSYTPKLSYTVPIVLNMHPYMCGEFGGKWILNDSEKTQLVTLQDNTMTPYYNSAEYIAWSNRDPYKNASDPEPVTYTPSGGGTAARPVNPTTLPFPSQTDVAANPTAVAACEIDVTVTDFEVPSDDQTTLNANIAAQKILIQASTSVTVAGTGVNPFGNYPNNVLLGSLSNQPISAFVDPNTGATGGSDPLDYLLRVRSEILEQTTAAPILRLTDMFDRGEYNISLITSAPSATGVTPLTSTAGQITTAGPREIPAKSGLSFDGDSYAAVPKTVTGYVQLTSNPDSYTNPNNSVDNAIPTFYTIRIYSSDQENFPYNQTQIVTSTQLAAHQPATLSDNCVKLIGGWNWATADYTAKLAEYDAKLADYNRYLADPGSWVGPVPSAPVAPTEPTKTSYFGANETDYDNCVIEQASVTAYNSVHTNVGFEFTGIPAGIQVFLEVLPVGFFGYNLSDAVVNNYKFNIKSPPSKPETPEVSSEVTIPNPNDGGTLSNLAVSYWDQEYDVNDDQITYLVQRSFDGTNWEFIKNDFVEGGTQDPNPSDPTIARMNIDDDNLPENAVIQYRVLAFNNQVNSTTPNAVEGVPEIPGQSDIYCDEDDVSDSGMAQCTAITDVAYPATPPTPARYAIPSDPSVAFHTAYQAPALKSISVVQETVSSLLLSWTNEAYTGTTPGTTFKMQYEVLGETDSSWENVYECEAPFETTHLTWNGDPQDGAALYPPTPDETLFPCNGGTGQTRTTDKVLPTNLRIAGLESFEGSTYHFRVCSTTYGGEQCTQFNPFLLDSPPHFDGGTLNAKATGTIAELSVPTFYEGGATIVWDAILDDDGTSLKPGVSYAGRFRAYDSLDPDFTNAENGPENLDKFMQWSNKSPTELSDEGATDIIQGACKWTNGASVGTSLVTYDAGSKKFTCKLSDTDKLDSATHYIAAVNPIAIAQFGAGDEMWGTPLTAEFDTAAKPEVPMFSASDIYDTFASSTSDKAAVEIVAPGLEECTRGLVEDADTSTNCQGVPMLGIDPRVGVFYSLSYRLADSTGLFITPASAEIVPAATFYSGVIIDDLLPLTTYEFKLEAFTFAGSAIAENTFTHMTDAPLGSSYIRGATIEQINSSEARISFEIPNATANAILANPALAQDWFEVTQLTGSTTAYLDDLEVACSVEADMSTRCFLNTIASLLNEGGEYTFQATAKAILTGGAAQNKAIPDTGTFKMAIKPIEASQSLASVYNQAGSVPETVAVVDTTEWSTDGSTPKAKEIHYYLEFCRWQDSGGTGYCEDTDVVDQDGWSRLATSMTESELVAVANKFVLRGLDSNRIYRFRIYAENFAGGTYGTNFVEYRVAGAFYFDKISGLQTSHTSTPDRGTYTMEFGFPYTVDYTVNAEGDNKIYEAPDSESINYVVKIKASTESVYTTLNPTVGANTGLYQLASYTLNSTGTTLEDGVKTIAIDNLYNGEYSIIIEAHGQYSNDSIITYEPAFITGTPSDVELNAHQVSAASKGAPGGYVQLYWTAQPNVFYEVKSRLHSDDVLYNDGWDTITGTVVPGCGAIFGETVGGNLTCDFPGALGAKYDFIITQTSPSYPQTFKGYAFYRADQVAPVVQNVKASQAGNTVAENTRGMITVTWDPLTPAAGYGVNSDGTSTQEEVKYKLQYRKVGATNWNTIGYTAPHELLDQDAVQGVVLDNLGSNTQWEIRVYASTLAGESPLADILTYGLASRPGLVTNIDVHQSAQSEATITFNKPTGYVGTDLVFDYQCFIINSDGEEQACPASGPQSVTFSNTSTTSTGFLATANGLTLGTTYRFKIRGTSVVGASNYASTADFILQNTYAIASLDVKQSKPGVIGTTSSLRIKFSEGYLIGGVSTASLDYKVDVFAGNTATFAGVTPIQTITQSTNADVTFDNLPAGATYTVRVAPLEETVGQGLSIYKAITTAPFVQVSEPSANYTSSQIDLSWGDSRQAIDFYDATWTPLDKEDLSYTVSYEIADISNSFTGTYSTSNVVINGTKAQISGLSGFDSGKKAKIKVCATSELYTTVNCSEFEISSATSRPPNPTNFVATMVTGGDINDTVVNITYNTVSTADHYFIGVKLCTADDYDFINVGASTSVTLTVGNSTNSLDALATNSCMSFTVKAVDDNVDSVISSSVDKLIPGPTTTITQFEQDTINTISASWDASKAEVGAAPINCTVGITYKVEVSEEAEGWYELTGSGDAYDSNYSPSSTSVELGDFDPATHYKLRVTPISSCTGIGRTAVSDTILSVGAPSTPLWWTLPNADPNAAKPVVQAAAQASSGSVTLSWQASEPGVGTNRELAGQVEYIVEYRIVRWEDGSDVQEDYTALWSESASTDQLTTEITGLDKNTVYEFRVKAISGSSHSSPNTEVEFGTEALVPHAPVDVKLAQKSTLEPGVLIFTWKRNPLDLATNPLTYELRDRSYGGAGWNGYANITTTEPITDEDASSSGLRFENSFTSGRYQFEVKSKNDIDESYWPDAMAELLFSSTKPAAIPGMLIDKSELGKFTVTFNGIPSHYADSVDYYYLTYKKPGDPTPVTVVIPTPNATGEEDYTKQFTYIIGGADCEDHTVATQNPSMNSDGIGDDSVPTEEETPCVTFGLNYTFTLQAHNFSGLSDAYKTSVQAASTVPFSPQAIVSSPTSDETHVKISFTPGYDGGSPLVKYTLLYRPRELASDTPNVNGPCSSSADTTIDHNWCIYPGNLRADLDYFDVTGLLSQFVGDDELLPGETLQHYGGMHYDFYIIAWNANGSSLDHKLDYCDSSYFTGTYTPGTTVCQGPVIKTKEESTPYNALDIDIISVAADATNYLENFASYPKITAGPGIGADTPLSPAGEITAQSAGEPEDVQLNWAKVTPPRDNNSPIVNYNVAYRLHQDDLAEMTPTSLDALSSGGSLLEDQSATLNPMTLTPEDAIPYSAAITFYSPISIALCDSSWVCDGSAHSTRTSHVIAGLIPDQLYDFAVFAENSVGKAYQSSYVLSAKPQDLYNLYVIDAVANGTVTTDKNDTSLDAIEGISNASKDYLFDGHFPGNEVQKHVNPFNPTSVTFTSLKTNQLGAGAFDGFGALNVALALLNPFLALFLIFMLLFIGFCFLAAWKYKKEHPEATNAQVVNYLREQASSMLYWRKEA